ncbi:class I SAM-dependent methyltransferase [Lysobacter niastensis]|uniref:Class I SAM-dependent methyltransferase n=1 Tax=Lysobacter niastensis TaxID=380629 RepID=A0ABS0B4R9_9GAMM|nr:class I SAM-dependent methyltransferase [Lysobacter niastensis]MBF6022878.1 class I SAM-dependent methyltransferase [Lysobacter niastensis]
MTRSAEQLDQARRQWLAGLAARHAAEDSADSALALARGEWMCGDYEDAIGHFIQARDRARQSAEAHLALVRAASMTGQRDLESAALGEALALHAGDPDLALHAALDRVPEDLQAARALLAPHRERALCAEFDQAIAAIESGHPPQPVQDADPRQQARADSLRWVMAQRRTPDAHVGLPARVLERALALAPADGITLECGVYFGRSLRLIARATTGPVHGFDSFQGLPEAWSAQEGAGAYSTAGRMPWAGGNVQLHAGWFEDTLPGFFARETGPVRLLHVDCDLYSSTRTVLQAADAGLVPGSVIVFDDLLAYPGYEDHELKAFLEFADKRHLDWEVIGACLLGREVAIRITAR